MIERFFFSFFSPSSSLQHNSQKYNVIKIYNTRLTLRMVMVMVVAIGSAHHIYRDNFKYSWKSVAKKINNFFCQCVISHSIFSWVECYACHLNILWFILCKPRKKWFLWHLKAYPCCLAIWLTYGVYYTAIWTIKKWYERKSFVW